MTDVEVIRQGTNDHAAYRLPCRYAVRNAPQDLTPVKPWTRAVGPTPRQYRNRYWNFTKTARFVRWRRVQSGGPPTSCQSVRSPRMRSACW